ncbi:hypothetical protein SLNSH_22790 [Alsobacter soli]|uniref:DNA-binding protein n=1 Tax=Alsobacter soli TaxID=2109933 RepID=A0A2T1HM77_9HYPH|nr:hypothetical protein [Alsobacter soli]PSC02691.1 hypothetical protein SLNSH_22790 [Alsobacter soli]
MTDDLSKYLRRDRAAKYLQERYGIGTSANSLAVMAHKGTGPQFRLFGRFPIYHPADLDAWAESRVSARKFARTAEYVAAVA